MLRNALRVFRVIAYAVLPALLSSCGPNSEEIDPAKSDDIDQDSLPRLSELRSPNKVHLWQVDGTDPIMHSSGFGMAPPESASHFAHLSAEAGKFEWAIYAFVPGEETLLEVSVALAVPIWLGVEISGPAFIAISDYERVSWHVSGPINVDALSDYRHEELLDAEVNLSPEGVAYIAVIAPPGSTFGIGMLEFSATDNGPTSRLIADLTEGDAPLVVSFDASQSKDDDGGGIVLFEWDVDGDFDFDFDTGTNPTLRHVFNSPGTMTVGVRVTDTSGLTSESTRTIKVR